MNYLASFISIFLTCISIIPLYSKNIQLPENYASIVEKLIYYKNNNLTVFYGGPIEKHDIGARWIMPCMFTNSQKQTRAVYEICFVNCTPNNCLEAEIFFVNTPEIAIKLQDKQSKDFLLFSSLINGTYKKEHYIVVRYCDISNIFFPNIFISSLYEETYETDKKEITDFLHNTCKSLNTYHNLYNYDIPKDIISYEDDNEIIYVILNNR